MKKNDIIRILVDDLVVEIEKIPYPDRVKVVQEVIGSVMHGIFDDGALEASEDIKKEWKQ